MSENHSLKTVIIGIGSNVFPEGQTRDFHINQALNMLNCHNINVLCTSKLYVSSALGHKTKSSFTNAAVLISTSLSPESLFTRLKQIERCEGRRGFSRPWGDRTLDLDLINYQKVIWNWDLVKLKPLKKYKKRLVLPHAQTHLRPFVLRPLQDIMPGWRHPVLKLTIDQLLKRSEMGTGLIGGKVLNFI